MLKGIIATDGDIDFLSCLLVFIPLLFHAYIDRVYVPLESKFSFEYTACVFDIGFITH